VIRLYRAFEGSANAASSGSIRALVKMLA